MKTRHPMTLRHSVCVQSDESHALTGDARAFHPRLSLVCCACHAQQTRQQTRQDLSCLLSCLVCCAFHVCCAEMHSRHEMHSRQEHEMHSSLSSHETAFSCAIRVCKTGVPCAKLVSHVQSGHACLMCIPFATLWCLLCSS